ncbi:MAG TPA: type IV pilus assembly protein PilM, partial [Gemmata sp.]|nr:type IV pilus assembly protein PilM [Gemmata sp.]
MAVAKGVWGIDIGQCALKALRLELVDGKPVATAFDYVEHTKILSQPDADPDALIREALDKFLSRNQVKTDEVAIGIAGQSGLARFVKLPPVEEKKIAEIVKFEAKQQIPFPLDEVVWDFQKISGGEAVDGFALETEIGLFAMKRDVISRYLGYFAGSKIEVHTVQMSPLALVNFATYEILKKGGPALPETPPEEEPADDAPRGKKRCAVVMDIGTDASNLIITDGAKIIWQRPIPLGGNNFTRALTKELKLTFAKAEHLKRNAAKSPEMANILKAIKPVLTDFVGEVQRSLGYFTNTHRDAHVAYLVGLGSAFKLPGLQKYLGDKLSL